MIKNIFGHLKNILTHKFWVCYFGRKIGLSWWRCLMHDMSKFSLTEFWESVEYYQGTSSPIPICKKDKGYSKAWQHHKGHNPHHYEYWTDNYDTQMTLIPMPFEYIEEMIADWCAAGRTYQGKKWTFDSQCEWWEHKKTLNPSIHLKTQRILNAFFWRYKYSSHKDPFEWWRINRNKILKDYNN